MPLTLSCRTRSYALFPPLVSCATWHETGQSTQYGVSPQWFYWQVPVSNGEIFSWWIIYLTELLSRKIYQTFFLCLSLLPILFVIFMSTVLLLWPLSGRHLRLQGWRRTWFSRSQLSKCFASYPEGIILTYLLWILSLPLQQSSFCLKALIVIKAK